ncbi:carboxypeptidase-like regulatory domain-containing protein [Hymenobacter sp. BT188]|uniref:carboxypeptidase-like regulatory domain-containing protein n=1 Tax=Hymenobacter sp. BT188 TaxID=2763504 RepID=UPI0016515E5A|nr:carboxypeptidase-like regulatory domain-containing protein [Hymenobacter sp. BT188]
MKLSFLFLSSLLYLLLPISGVAQTGKSASSVPVSRQATKSQPTTTQAPTVTPAATDMKPAEVIKPAEPANLTGTVVDETGKALAGVTVSLVGAPQESSITNSAGGFLLRSLLPSPVLRVSYAGYEQQEVATKGAAPMAIQLNKLPNYERQRKQREKAAEKAYRKP